jgi:hypothetical protein
VRELFCSCQPLLLPVAQQISEHSARLLSPQSTHKYGTSLPTAPMADTATSGLPLCSPLLPVRHPMAETREAQGETEEPGSEGAQAFFPLWKHSRDEENPEGAGHVCPRTASRDYR